MDQCGAFGQVPMLMTFEGDSLGVQRLALGAALYLVLVDLRASKDTVAILAALQVPACFLCPGATLLLPPFEQHRVQALGATVPSPLARSGGRGRGRRTAG